MAVNALNYNMVYNRHTANNAGSAAEKPAKTNDPFAGIKLEYCYAYEISVGDDGKITQGAMLDEERQKEFPPGWKLTSEVCQAMMIASSGYYTYTQNKGLDRAANSISLVPGMRINMGSDGYINIDDIYPRPSGGRTGAPSKSAIDAAVGLNYLIRIANNQFVQTPALFYNNSAIQQATLNALRSAGIDTSRPFYINETKFEVQSGVVRKL